MSWARITVFSSTWLPEKKHKEKSVLHNLCISLWKIFSFEIWSNSLKRGLLGEIIACIYGTASSLRWLCATVHCTHLDSNCRKMSWECDALDCILILNRKGLHYHSGQSDLTRYTCSLSLIWEKIAFFCYYRVYEVMVRHHSPGTCELRGESWVTEFRKGNNCRKIWLKLQFLWIENSVGVIFKDSEGPMGNEDDTVNLYLQPADLYCEECSLVKDWYLTFVKKDVLRMHGFISVYIFVHVNIYM